jgi:hypothetical protein
MTAEQFAEWLDQQTQKEIEIINGADDDFRVVADGREIARQVCGRLFAEEGS